MKKKFSYSKDYYFYLILIIIIIVNKLIINKTSI